MSRVVALVVAGVLVVATLVAAAAGFSYDARQRQVRANDVNRAALRSLTMELDGLVASTREVAALFQASHNVDAREFLTFTAPILRDSSASSFGWLAHVTDAERASWERAHGARITVTDATGRSAAAPRRHCYNPVLLTASAGPLRIRPGLDTSVDPVREQVLLLAARLGRPRATPVIRLAGSDARGIVVYASVRRPDGRLQGTALGAFRVSSLVASMAGVLPRGSAFELRQGGRRVEGLGDLGRHPTSRVAELGGQRWVILTAPASAGRLGTGIIVLLVGGLLSAVVLLGLSGLAREAGRARRMATQNEERFAQAFEHAPVGMALLDASGRHVRVNDAMCQLVARSRDALLGAMPEDVMPPEEAAACHSLIAALVRGDQTSFRGDTRLLTADGRRLRVAVHITVLERSEDGEAPILVHATDVTEQRLAESRMRHLADHDPLTGLLNRRGFGEALRTQVAHARRYGAHGALLILDLDGFKAVNDALGHDAGDRVLLQVSGELRACLRETDVVARLGGDEFALILPRESLEEATVVAEKITERVRGAAIGAGPSVPAVTVSVGVAAFTADDETGEEVMRAADLAMYSAKAAGRDRYVAHGAPARVV